MIKGEKRRFVLTVSRSIAFTPTAVNISVYNSSGGIVSATSATVAPASGLIEVFTSNAIDLTWAGTTRLVWTYTDNAEVNTPVEYRFVSYLDLPSMIRAMLDKDSTTLPDSQLELYIARVVRLLEIEYPLLPTYAGLTGNDQFLMDEALTLIVSWYLAPDTISSVPAGQLKAVTIGLDAYEFSGVPNLPINDDTWLGQGIEILSQISTLKDYFTAQRNKPLFVTAGGRRAARTALGLTDSTTPLYDLRSDARMGWAWERIYATYFH